MKELIISINNQITTNKLMIEILLYQSQHV